MNKIIGCNEDGCSWELAASSVQARRYEFCPLCGTKLTDMDEYE